MEKVEKERQGVTLNENTLNKRIISFDIIPSSFEKEEARKLPDFGISGI